MYLSSYCLAVFRLLFFLGIVAFARESLAQEQWVTVSTVNTIPVSVDQSRIVKAGTRVKSWVRSQNLSGTLDIRWLMEFDCASGRYRTIETVTRLGTEIQTQSGDVEQPFVGIGKESGYVPAYQFSCRSAGLEPDQPSDQIYPKALPNRPTEDSEWVQVIKEQDQTIRSIDYKGMRIDEGRILAWVKTASPVLNENIYTLYEYDCVGHRYRIHAFNNYRFPEPGGWGHPTDFLTQVFSLPCAILERTSVPSKNNKQHKNEDSKKDTRKQM